MNNELYPSSFKPNQSSSASSYRNSMPPCDCSTFRPPPIAQSSAGGQLPGTDQLLKQQQLTQQKLSQQRQSKIVPNGTNSFLLQANPNGRTPNKPINNPAAASNQRLPTATSGAHSLSASLNGPTSNRVISSANNKINLRSKSPPPKPPERFTSKLMMTGNQPDGSPLWRSKSFAGGLQQSQQQSQQYVHQSQPQQPPNGQFNHESSKNALKPRISLRQPPITYANPSAAVNRNTIHLGKQSDDHVYGFNNNLPGSVACNQSCCKNLKSPTELKPKGSNNINKVNDEISQRYLAAAENNFNGLNRMRHSQSHHSYLAAKAPNNQTASSFNTGTLPTSVSVHGQLSKSIKQPGSLDASSLSSIGSSGSGSLTRNSAFLSQKYSSVGNLNQPRKFFGGLSLGAKNNNRNPQPQRSLMIFGSIEKGLRECICLTQEDISQLKTAIANGVQLSSAQQYKNAERYLKRLEFQLAKIEELRDQYEMHMKMSDGVRGMATAYAFSPGKEKEVALSSVRNELKEYLQTMSIVESELEQSMGSFLLQMQGIQGFARLCPGDVFEITIKCGEKQKWKCKGKILKNNTQSWDSTEQIFRPNLSDQLSVKAVELRGLGKKLCLGSKNCEIKDLFSARPQLMSICLNTTGTLKLHLIVTWNPLHEPKSSSLHGLLSNSIQGSSLTGGNSTLTKSKSFTASSTSLFSKFRSGGGGSSTNNSSTYSTLNLSNNYAGNNNSLFNRTLNNSNNKRCTLPSGFEIIDADYYHHPHLIAEANRQEQLNKRMTMHGALPATAGGNPVSRVNSMLVPASNGLANKHNNRHSYAGHNFNHTSLSPIHSPNLRTDENADDEVEAQLDCNQNNRSNKNVVADKKADPKCQQQQQFKQINNLTSLTSNVDGITPTSTGSRGSSLHLTGTTTSSGFGSSGSSSSYCSSSVPNSALTSPDSEQAPCESNNKPNNKTATNKTRSIQSNNSSPIQCDIYDCNHCGQHSNGTGQQLKSEQQTESKSNLNNNRNSIVVEATVHQNPEANSLRAAKAQKDVETVPSQMPRSTSMPVQLSASQRPQQQTNKPRIPQTHSQNNLKPPSSAPQYNRTESTDTLTTPDVAYQPTYFNVGDTLINLMSSLEDIQGQFSELHSLQENVINLYKVLCQVSKLRILNNNLQNAVPNSANAGAVPKTANGQQRLRRSSDASNISVSVESALECFDFLNQTGTDSEVDSVVCTPEHRAKLDLLKTANASDNNHSALSTPCPTPTPSPSLQSTQQLSTNCDQIDIALMSHLIYCQRLIESLGTFGPLKSREQSSLAKLQLQAQAVERLVRVCVHLRDYLQVSIELRKDSRLKQNSMDLALELENLYGQFKQQEDLELTNCFANDPRIAKLWDFVCYLHTIDHEDENLSSQFTQIDLGVSATDKQSVSLGSTLLCCTSAGFALCLEKFMQINNLVPTSGATSALGQLSISMSNLAGLGLQSNAHSSNKKLKGNELTSKISELITKRLIDAPTFESDFVVSLFQLCIFFQSENASLEHLFKLYSQEVQLLNSLQSNDAIEIEHALKQFKRTLPPKEPLMSISLLLLDSDELVVRIAEAYFLNAAKNKSIRAAILTQLLDALQNDSAQLRQAACLAMTLLNGSEYLNQLVFICTVDTSERVRNQAKQTLLSFGKEGQQLYLDSQRFNHGFQGLIVK